MNNERGDASFCDWADVKKIKWHPCICGHFDQVDNEEGLCSKCLHDRRKKSNA
jgi:hypothetical protein